MSLIPTHPRLRFWLEFGGALAIAAETGWRRAHTALRPCRSRSYAARQPGCATPLWNVLASALKRELRPWGAKSRLARYLGIPRQRLYEFLTRKNHLPDAEVTLRLLHWLNETRRRRDPSI